VALVISLTGGLCYFVTQLYEAAERARIERDLAKDAEQLRAGIQFTGDIIRAKLSPSLLSGAFQRLLRSRAEFPEIKEGLSHYAEVWRSESEADIGIACLDVFVAEDRKATVVQEIGEVAVCGLEMTGDDSNSFRAELLRAPELKAALEGALLDETVQSAIFSVDQRVLYLVAMPFYDGLGDDAEVVGTAAVIEALDSSWIDRHGQSGRENNTAQLLLFTDNAVSATVIPESQGSRLLAASASSPTMGFVADLTLNGAHERYVGLTQRFGGDEDTSSTGFVAFKSLDRELVPMYRLLWNVVFGGIFVALIGAAGAYFLAYLTIRRIDRLKDATVSVREGNFDVHLAMKGRDEITALGTAFNDMVVGLKALGLYTDPTLARSVMGDANLADQAGSREEGTVFFSDIQGFTKIAESMEAEPLVEQLNEYFSVMSEHVKKEDGYLDKFIGDSVMAYWGVPFITEQDYAIRAVRAALGCVQPVAELSARWIKEGKSEFLHRIGIASGSIVVGNIGSTTKKNYTLIGDSVNLASRLEGTNKEYGTRILIDHATWEMVRDEILCREIDAIIVVGKTIAVNVYEPLCAHKDATEEDQRKAELYTRALTEYRGQRFQTAVDTLSELLTEIPGDRPAQILRRKAEHCHEHGVEEDWDAVTRRLKK
jgi:class 3 adenylate cyclase